MFIIAEDCLTRKCGSGSVCINFIQTERWYTNYTISDYRCACACEK